MRHVSRRAVGSCAALLFVLLAGPTLAGGLVDTSPRRFSQADFTNSQSITNPWWTLSAGTNFLYFARDGDDCVWDLTEVLGTTVDAGGDFAGIYADTNARIVLDRGWVDAGCTYGGDFAAFMASQPVPEEVTFDWYAQDGEQNIWYMGEHTFNGVDYAGSFVAGCDGAEAGILLLGTPAKGAFYSQEFYAGEAEDWGKVLNFKMADELVCMKTKEWTPLEPGATEHKWYCSDGAVGQLTSVEELHGRTVHTELFATNVPAPPAVGLPVDPAPACPLLP